MKPTSRTPRQALLHALQSDDGAAASKLVTAARAVVDVVEERKRFEERWQREREKAWRRLPPAERARYAAFERVWSFLLLHEDDLDPVELLHRLRAERRERTAAKRSTKRPMSVRVVVRGPDDRGWYSAEAKGIPNTLAITQGRSRDAALRNLVDCVALIGGLVGKPVSKRGRAKR